MKSKKKIFTFKECYDESTDTKRDKKTTEELRSLFFAPDFDFDWSPRDRPFAHDLNIRANGNIYRIEEKRRLKDFKLWFDTELLEDISNEDTGTAGWAWGCGMADYVLFTYPTLRGDIYPGPLLEQAWRRRRHYWLDKYGWTPAFNKRKGKTYKALNIEVPRGALRCEMLSLGGEACIDCGRIIGSYSVCCKGPYCRRQTCCAVSGIYYLCPEHRAEERRFHED